MYPPVAHRHISDGVPFPIVPYSEKIEGNLSFSGTSTKNAKVAAIKKSEGGMTFIYPIKGRGEKNSSNSTPMEKKTAPV